MTETEIQQDVQRFTGDFMARVGDAADALLEQLGPTGREQLLRRTLVYDAAVLDIATGPVPPVNLLDMLVFVSLARTLFEQYWLPEVFGDSAGPLAAALRRSEDDLWQRGEKVLDESQRADLRELIATWLREHPGQVRVESVRLSDFSEQAGRAVRGRKATGLLASVRSVTRTADEAVLLGERAVFLAQRAPFLLRLQTRLGAHEITSDGITRARELEPMLTNVAALPPLVSDLSTVAAHALETAKEVRALSVAVRPLLDQVQPLLSERARERGNVTGLEAALDTAHRLSDTSLSLVREVRALAELGGSSALRNVSRGVEGLLRRWLIYLAAAGVGWVALFWGGYYVVMRALARQAAAEAPSASAGRE